MLFTLFALSCIAELFAIFCNHRRQWQIIILAAAVFLIGFSTGLAIVNYGLALGLPVLFTGAYRLLALLRIAENRRDRLRIKRTASRTSLVLTVSQTTALAAAVYQIKTFDLASRSLLTGISLFTGASLLIITAYNLKKTRVMTPGRYYSDKELPTVTVAIPARNETAELASCLETIVASNYPKLEILVLDDCSLGRTAEIIRDFAQEGVRFIEGKPPKDGWLGKNQAYQMLADAASGEIILFCGVDIRFDVVAIKNLVLTMLNRQKTMISIMPLRIGGGIRTSFIQPMRYWWEIALPRRQFNRPPVLSSCWLIHRQTLVKLGGFKAVRGSIIPERYFARELIKSDGYSFIRADELLDVRTVKNVEAQLNTAVRTRYVQLERRPENAMLLSVALIALMLVPFVTALTGIIGDMSTVTKLAGLASGLLVFAHYSIMRTTNPANTPIALLNFPLVIITEVILINLSMYKYEFGEVEWKGRDICLPRLEAIPKLPEV